MTLRVLLLSPAVLPSATGNATTAERWRRSLTELGQEVRALATAGRSPAEIAAEVEAFRPHLVHAHHAYRAGAPAAAGVPEELPLVVSLAGTDVHVDLGLPDRREAVARACCRAAAIVAQGRDLGRKLGEELPRVRARIVPVPKAFAWLGDEPWDLRQEAGWGAGDFLFFVPAGVRPVKGNLEVLRALEALHRVRPQIRAAFAGPALDPGYAAAFEREVGRLGAFARWLPPVPPSRMRAAYGAADAVVNGSFAEGTSNALMEALAAGRPVLASDVPGNRQVLAGLNGSPPAALIFDPREPAAFVRQAERLVDDPEQGRALGRAGLELAGRWPTAEEEAEALVRVYMRALDQT